MTERIQGTILALRKGAHSDISYSSFFSWCSWLTKSISWPCNERWSRNFKKTYVEEFKKTLPKVELQYGARVEGNVAMEPWRPVWELGPESPVTQERMAQGRRARPEVPLPACESQLSSLVAGWTWMSHSRVPGPSQIRSLCKWYSSSGKIQCMRLGLATKSICKWWGFTGSLTVKEAQFGLNL